MIREITVWAAGSWHILEARAVVLGVIARPGGPLRLLDLDARTFLALIEGVLREVPEHAEILDGFYIEARPKRSAPVRRDRRERNREIRRVMGLFR